MTKIIDGKKVSKEIKENLKKIIELFPTKPKLAVIQVGDDSASEIYVNMKRKETEKIGIDFMFIKYDSDINEEIIEETIKSLNKDKSINGILIQLPLPSNIDSKRILNLIDPSKDVDGLTDYNIAKLINKEDAIIPCTPFGIIKLLEYYNIDVRDKNIVVVGRSNLVGRPLSNILLNMDATVTVCHSKTKDLKEYTKRADILFVATGKKHLITRDMIKRGAVLIDVGINRENDKLYGDINFDNVYKKCSMITPVPGGVGPMTIAMLLYNLVSCYKKQK
ncbi:MAG: bifunctional methylenetetrahydrofolate dehydrogenase/methenyltetrahydrofolate cyclohydrolase FolD [Bacilli bacterium]|nr:bifunctional methylenetetrahydrofolate dehydrogenase/methenyltetrahydrofolate cyclohydrolase FolD [Bacilli bacterium]